MFKTLGVVFHGCQAFCTATKMSCRGCHSVSGAPVSALPVACWQHSSASSPLTLPPAAPWFSTVGYGCVEHAKHALFGTATSRLLRASSTAALAVEKLKARRCISRLLEETERYSRLLCNQRALRLAARSVFGAGCCYGYRSLPCPHMGATGATTAPRWTIGCGVAAEGTVTTTEWAAGLSRGQL